MTPREAAVAAYGESAVHAYELVKGFYTRYGYALEVEFAAVVGGRLGRRGAPGTRGEPDVVTALGAFEFCAQANSKNAAGRASDTRVDVVRVQASGSPKFGRISGVEFLELHGVAGAAGVARRCEEGALERARSEDQLRLWKT